MYGIVALKLDETESELLSDDSIPSGGLLLLVGLGCRVYEIALSRISGALENGSDLKAKKWACISSKTATLKALLISSLEMANPFIWEDVGSDSGFTFLYCKITRAGNSTTYLGRPWKLRPRVIFTFTYMGTIINSEGWSTEGHPERNHNQ
ncbi:Uncharacterized protein TCM_037467 [Theobroma cacao]|uniref:pectinesterase n=1 Tax=Theobroma cacao TaxID=3641 RepID=A0A061GSV3_THECC|nr:Uncharacterized protein TCM_037467 [Theobroma cacao]